MARPDTLKPGVTGVPLTEHQRSTIRDVLDARGFRGVELPDTNDPIDFCYLHFSDPIFFDGFVFVGPTSFEGSQFDGHSHSFEAAVFTTAVTFENAHFSGVFFGPDTVFADAAFLRKKRRSAKEHRSPAASSEAGQISAEFGSWTTLGSTTASSLAWLHLRILFSKKERLLVQPNS